MNGMVILGILAGTVLGLGLARSIGPDLLSQILIGAGVIAFGELIGRIAGALVQLAKIATAEYTR